ncbi:MAG: flagellin [Candidatus Sumerlaeia bacterium]
MSIRINENIFSLFVNRNIARRGQDLDNAFRKLSSGEKINKSGDDPAGLANSHILRAKIQGFQRNLINCNEGLNLLSVAESSLSNVNDILQRIRELSIQAASDTVSDQQRSLIQEEIDAQLDEIQRIAEQSNYNNRNLLDGSFQDLRLQVGTRMDESMPISIASAQTSVLGSVAQVTGNQAVSTTPIIGNGDLLINNVVIPQSVFDEVSTINGDASALAKAKAINSVHSQTHVYAKADKTEYREAGSSIADGSLDGAATSLTINNVNIGSLNFAAGDANQTLRERINGLQSLTGVSARLGVGGELILEAEDGRNIHVQTTGSMADELGLLPGNGDVDIVATGTISLRSSDTIQVNGNTGLVGFTPGQATTFVDFATAIENLSVTTFDNAQAAIETVDAAFEQLTGQRTTLGALEGRINETINDIMVNVENLSGADSRIRDADFAVETANLTQAQIIHEASVAILSQANVIPRMALNLLEQ